MTILTEYNSTFSCMYGYEHVVVHVLLLWLFIITITKKYPQKLLLLTIVYASHQIFISWAIF